MGSSLSVACSRPRQAIGARCALLVKGIIKAQGCDEMLMLIMLHCRKGHFFAEQAVVLSRLCSQGPPQVPSRSCGRLAG
jgi:hypothetical protein